MGRTRKVIKNIGASAIGNLASLVFKFINRLLLVYILGKEYLGIGSLFASIFAVLDLAELGIGDAIVYALYDPLAQKDTEKIKSLIALYKKYYRIIGVFVAVAGLLLFPFIEEITGSKSGIVNLQLLYLLQLFQAVIGYFCFSYKYAIIGADQKGYITTGLDTAISAGILVCQGAVLFFTGSYTCYMVSGVILQIGKNFLLSRKAEELYPYLKDKETAPLPEEERSKIKNNVKGLAMYKISSKVLSSTDTIIISIILGVGMVGVYDNYNYLWMLAVGTGMMLFNTYTPVIGNVYATESKEKLETLFRILSFGNFWVYGLVSGILLLCGNQVIEQIFGADYVLPDIILWLIVLNLVTSGLQNTVIVYKDACGLYYAGRYRPLISALLNLFLSILFGYAIGLAGIILATIISRILTTWWFDAWLLHRRIFEKSPAGYYRRYLTYFAVSMTVNAGTCYLAECIITAEGIPGILLRAVLGMIVINIAYLLCYSHSPEFHAVMGKAKTILKKIVNKVKGKRLQKR